ncbi:hypothetical protein E4U35_003469 [Claviceps purpurea]|nr:hypothetical protein E4U11_006505 [Claviceps purpurea]KAG6204353.1 hypothetical protein E4U35_003469 [Claviceps purpurea]
MDDNEDESRMDLIRNTDNDVYTDDAQMNRGPPAHHKEQKRDPRHHILTRLHPPRQPISIATTTTPQRQQQQHHRTQFEATADVPGESVQPETTLRVDSGSDHCPWPPCRREQMRTPILKGVRYVRVM